MGEIENIQFNDQNVYNIVKSILKKAGVLNDIDSRSVLLLKLFYSGSISKDELSILYSEAEKELLHKKKKGGESIQEKNADYFYRSFIFQLISLFQQGYIIGDHKTTNLHFLNIVTNDITE